MGRFKDRSQVRQFVEQQITPPAGRGLKGYAEATQTLTVTSDKLANALRYEDADAIKLQARLIGPQKQAAQLALGWLSKASEQIDVLAGDASDEVTTELEMMEPLIQKISEGKERLAAWIRRADALVTQADKVVAKIAHGERAAATRWNFIMASHRSRSNALQRLLDEANRCHAAGLAAVRSRDAAALAKCQQSTAVWASDARAVTFDGMREAIQGFLKEYDFAGFSLPFRTQVNRESKELGAMAARAKPLTLEILTKEREIQGMVIGPPDAAAAGKVLGVPSKLHGQLKKALHQSGSGLVKALDEVGRQAGLETGGHEMVAKLKRAKLVT